MLTVSRSLVKETSFPPAAKVIYHPWQAVLGMRSFSAGAVIGLLSLASIVQAKLNPIVVKGNAFFDSVTNERFYIRGVDYQVFAPHLYIPETRLTVSSPGALQQSIMIL